MKKMKTILMALLAMSVFAFLSCAANATDEYGLYKGKYFEFNFLPIESFEKSVNIPNRVSINSASRKVYITTTGQQKGVKREDNLRVSPALYTGTAIPSEWTTRFFFQKGSFYRKIWQDKISGGVIFFFQSFEKGGAAMQVSIYEFGAHCKTMEEYNGNFGGEVTYKLIKEAPMTYGGTEGWNTVISLMEKCAEMSGGKVVLDEEVKKFLGNSGCTTGNNCWIMTDMVDSHNELYSLQRINFDNVPSKYNVSRLTEIMNGVGEIMRNGM